MYWHLDVDLFTHISRFNPYPVRDEVDELPELEERPLEDLVVSCLKDRLPYIVRYYGDDYLTPTIAIVTTLGSPMIDRRCLEEPEIPKSSVLRSGGLRAHARADSRHDKTGRYVRCIGHDLQTTAFDTRSPYQ